MREYSHIRIFSHIHTLYVEEVHARSQVCGRHASTLRLLEHMGELLTRYVTYYSDTLCHVCMYVCVCWRNLT